MARVKKSPDPVYSVEGMAFIDDVDGLIGGLYDIESVLTNDDLNDIGAVIFRLYSAQGQMRSKRTKAEQSAAVLAEPTDWTT